jgi:cytochrome c-type biogenesis protein CcmF
LARGRWSVQLYIKPFIGWIWMGGVLMALGGLLAAIGLRRGRATA